MGEDGGVGAVDGPQDAATWETGLAMDGGASGKGSERGGQGALRDQDPVPGVLAGCKVCSPEEEPDDGSSHPGGPTADRGGSGSVGDAGDGDRSDGGDDGGGGCCCCSGGGGYCCCECGGGGGRGDLSGRGVSLED